MRAGKVLVDLKTGGFAPSHRDDLRFYALVETLRLGVPPRLLASYYLDGGRLQQEPVSEDTLRGAPSSGSWTAPTRPSRCATRAASPCCGRSRPAAGARGGTTCEVGRRYLERGRRRRGTGGDW